MKNFKQTNEMPIDLALFQVEELEERLENSWRTCHCPVESGSQAEGNYRVDYVPCDCDSPFRDAPPGGWKEQ